MTSWVVELELTSLTRYKPNADLTGVLAKQEQNVRPVLELTRCQSRQEKDSGPSQGPEPLGRIWVTFFQYEGRLSGSVSLTGRLA